MPTFAPVDRPGDCGVVVGVTELVFDWVFVELDVTGSIGEDLWVDGGVVSVHM